MITSNDAARRSGAPAPPVSPPDSASRYVYVIEDDVDVRDLLCEVLSSAGLVPVPASVPHFNRRLLSQQPPALAIVDLRLGRLIEPDGFEVIDDLRRRSSWRLPIVIHSGDIDLLRAQAQRIVSMPYTVVVPKPWDLELFEAVVATMIRLSRATAVEDVVLEGGLPVLIASEDARYLSANPAALEMLGYTLDELRQLSVSDVMAHASDFTEREWARYLERRTWTGPVTLYAKDGQTLDVSSRAAIITDLDERAIHVAWLRREPPTGPPPAQG